MAEIANILLPLFAIVALGAALRVTGFASPAFFRETNRLVYWVAIPCYLFYQTAEATIEGSSALRIFLVLVGGAVTAVALGFALARLRRLAPASTSAFVQGAFRGNLAYVGLPIVLLAFPTPSGQPEAGTRAIAVLAIAFMVPIYNFIALLVLVGGQEGGTRRWRVHLWQLARRLVSNPLLLSCVAGLIVVEAGWRLPNVLRQTCATIGAMTTPLALLGIGSALTFGHLRERWRDTGLAASVKLIASPLAGLALAVPLHLSALELRMALLYLATPSATAGYVMAQQLGADDALSADIIVLTTALSLPALAVVLALT